MMENALSPGQIERFEPMPPDPNLIRLTEKVLDQNRLILDMNAKLLHHLAAPFLLVGATVAEQGDADAPRAAE